MQLYPALREVVGFSSAQNAEGYDPDSYTCILQSGIKIISVPREPALESFFLSFFFLFFTL